jgi:predicted GNAT superfamily acetyltransferase
MSTVSLHDAPSAADVVDRTARRADVHLRELDEALETVRAAEVLQSVWGGSESVAPANWLRAVQHTGGYLFGAYDDAGVMLAVSIGLLSSHGLHSHITGVVPAGQRRGLGLALKQHQRAWCLDRGIATVTWTCDPLVRRNVAFNLHALGADIEEYLPDFYGPMADGVNRNDESDRFGFVWHLASPRAVEAERGRLPWLASSAPLAVEADADSRPVSHTLSGAARRVQLPADIEQLRRTDPEAGQAWRVAVREAVQAGLAGGAVITGLTAEGALVMEESS